MFNPATSPLSILDVWRSSWSLFKESLGKVWYLFFIEFCIITLLQVPSLLSKGAQTDSLSITNFLSIFTGFINVYVVTIVIHRLYAIATHDNISLLASIKIASQKFVRILLALFLVLILAVIVGIVLYTAFNATKSFALNAIVVNVIKGLGVLLFLVFLSLFLFLIPMILFKDKGLLAGLESVKLVWNNWLRTIAVFLLPAVAMILLFLLFVAIAIFAKSFFVTVLLLVLYTFAIIFALKPFSCCLLITQYQDLSLRKKQ